MTESVPEFRRLLETHAGALTRVVRSYARTAAERDDLGQTIALALWQAMPSFRGDASERTFVLRVAHNQALSFLARRRSRPEERELDSEAPSRALDPEALAGLSEQVRKVFRAIHALPLGQREVLVLALEGLGHDEIGEVLGISANNVAVRVNRARAELRKQMGGRDE
ncbi:MAG: sigma-70 family RNA polymerase sigma factor [Polyangiaceae bacterium]